jgi:hypothetical protein
MARDVSEIDASIGGCVSGMATRAVINSAAAPVAANAHPVTLKLHPISDFAIEIPLNPSNKHVHRVLYTTELWSLQSPIGGTPANP